MSWLPNLLRKDSKNTMPSHLHSIRIVCESADGVPPGCTAVKMRVLDRGSVAWDSPVSPVTPSTSKAQRGSCGDDALQAVWDPPTSCQLQLKMQQAPKEGWRKQEVSFQLLLQPSGQPGLWQELSAPISVDLAKHCPPPPAHPTPSASPTPSLSPDHISVAAAQDDRAELSTPIVLEWRSGRQRERQTRMQVLLVCSRGRVEVPPAPPPPANMAPPLGVNTKPSPPHLTPTPFSPTPSSPAPSSSFSLTPHPSPRSTLPDSPVSSMGLTSPPNSMGPQPLAALRVAALSPTPSPPAAAAAAAAAAAQSVCPSLTSRDLAPPFPPHPPTHNPPPDPTAHPLSPASSLAPSSGPTTPTHTTASPAATARPGSATGPRAGFEPGTFRGKLNPSLSAGQGCGMAPSHEMPVQELVTLLKRMTAPPAPAPAAAQGLTQEEHEMPGCGRQPSLSAASGSAVRAPPPPAPHTEQPAGAGGVSSSRAAGGGDEEGEAGVGEMGRRRVRQLGAVSLMPPLQAQGQPRQATDFLMASWGPAGSLPPAQAAPPDSFVMWLGSHTALPGSSLTSSASTSLHTHSQASDGSAPPASAAGGEGPLPTPPAAHAEVRASADPGSATDLVQHRLMLQQMQERGGLVQQEGKGRVAEPQARAAGDVAGLLLQEEQEGVREAQHVLAASTAALAAVDRTLAAADTSAAPSAAPAGPPAAAGGGGSQAVSPHSLAGYAPQAAASPIALSPHAASDSPLPATSPPSGSAALAAAQQQEGEGVREAQHVLAASRGAARAADRMLQDLDQAATPAAGTALLPGTAAAGEEGEGEEGEGEEEEDGDAEASLTSLASDHQAAGAPPPGPSTATSSTSAPTDTTFMMPSRTSWLSRPPPHDSSTSYVPDAPSFRGMPLVQLPGSCLPAPAAPHVSRAGSSSLTRNAQLDSAANAGSVDLGLAAGWGVEVEEEEEGMEGGWDMTSSPHHSPGLPAAPSGAGGEGSAALPPVHRRPASVAPGAGPRRTPQTSRCSSRSLGDVGLVSGGGSGGGAGGEGVVQLAAPVHAWVPWRPDTPSSPAAAPGGSMMQSRPSLHAPPSPPSPADSADSAPPLAPPPFLYTPQGHPPQRASSNDSPQPPMLIPALTAAPPEEAMEPPSPSPRPSPARSSSQGSMGLCHRDGSHLPPAFLTYYPLQFPAHPCTSPASAGGSSSRASLGRPLFDPHPSPGSSPATSPSASSASPAGPPPQLRSAFGAGVVLAGAAGGSSGQGPAPGTHRSSSGPAPGLSHFSTPFATPPCDVPPPTPGMRASSPPPLWGAASAPTSTHPPSAFHRGPSSPERMGASPVSLSRATSGSTSGSDLPCRGTHSSTGERRAFRTNQRRASACCPGWDMDGLSRGDMGGGLDRAGSCALPQQQQQQQRGGGGTAADVHVARHGRVPLAFGWVTGLAAAAGSSMAAPHSSVPASEPEAEVGAGQLGSGLGSASGAVQEDQRAGLGSGSGRVGSAEQLRRVASAQYVLAASAAAIKAVDFTLQVLDQPTPGPAAAPAGSGREAAGA
ncbi:hypothetical protein V8C86DRAFT_3207768 [Haematococcus lacustris]